MLPGVRPFWRRPLASNAIHIGVWLLFFCLILIILRRPWFAVTLVSAFLLFIVLVNNAKFQSLREPFIFQDFEYFTDALKYPRLYLPFLGIWRAAVAVIAFGLAFYSGVKLESSLTSWMSRADFFFMQGALFFSASVLLWWGVSKRMKVIFSPEIDLQRLGLITSLYRYAQEELHSPSLPVVPAMPSTPADSSSLPHLVVVQSESFFDARRLYSGVRKEVLEDFDKIKSAAVCQGQLEVAAWGANTVRSEFAFLSGLSPELLGVHRFNPYRKLARQGIPTLASFLKNLGYRTVCIHPYYSSFYARDKVFPSLGFDDFLDIESFKDDDKSGPYIGDVALAHKVCALLETSLSQPVFVFVISMENHGPLHLEVVEEEDVTQLYSSPPPPGCEDLTVYLRHLRNANRMAAILRDALQATARPSWLCWYGDHVPIMPKVYTVLQEPDGKTDFFLWTNESNKSVDEEKIMNIQKLGNFLLHKMNLKW